MTRKYTTLEGVVRDVLSQEEIETPHKFMRYLNIANAGLRELTFDIMGATKVAVLEVGNTMRVDLPEGFVDYTYIGILAKDGSLIPLGRKMSIPMTGDTNTTMENTTADILELELAVVSPQFGRGGGQNENGYYRPEIDYDNWQMVFSSTYVGTYIYMEFISDGRVSNGDTIVHPYAEEAIKAYIHWKDLQRKQNADPNRILMARKDYFNEKRLARARFCSFTKEEALQQIRKNFKQSPKY